MRRRFYATQRCKVQFRSIAPVHNAKGFSVAALLCSRGRPLKKSSSKEPFLPLFFGDFLGATAEWDGEERALYLLALGYQWTLGSLPADTRKLRKLLDYQQDVFERYWPTVSIKFQQQDNRLINPRLEQHRAKTQSLSEKNSEAGKKGAQKRWQKRHDKRHADDDDNSGGRHFKGEGENMANAINSDSKRHTKSLADAKPEDSDRHENAISERYGATDSNPSHPIPSHPIPIDTSSRASTSVETRAPDDSQFPNGEERKVLPEAAMAIPLRDLGVQVTSQHPTLLAWIRDGFTPQQAIDAVGIARIRKPHPEAIPAKYLDTILREPKRAPAPAKRYRTADELEAEELARETANAQH